MFVNTVIFQRTKTDIPSDRAGHENREVEFIAVRPCFFSQKELGVRRLFECSKGEKAQNMQGETSGVEHGTLLPTYCMIA